MTFVCQMCGECCSTMGEIIGIHEKTGDGEFRIRFSVTGEERLVVLDHDKKDLFYSKKPHSTLACPFLRDPGTGRCICTVHESRTDLCRQYSCFRILILSADRKRIGKVADNTRILTTSDPLLHDLWQKECRHVNTMDEECWEEEIAAIIKKRGYHVVY